MVKGRSNRKSAFPTVVTPYVPQSSNPSLISAGSDSSEAICTKQSSGELASTLRAMRTNDPLGNVAELTWQATFPHLLRAAWLGTMTCRGSAMPSSSGIPASSRIRRSVTLHSEGSGSSFRQEELLEFR